jgi:hypothetical protein
MGVNPDGSRGHGRPDPDRPAGQHRGGLGRAHAAQQGATAGPQPGADRGRGRAGRRHRRPPGGVDGSGRLRPRRVHHVAVPLRGRQGRAAGPDGRPELRGAAGPPGPGGELARRAGPLGLDRAGRPPAQPWVLQIPISGPPVTPDAMVWLERGWTACAAPAWRRGRSCRRCCCSPASSRLLARLTDPERFPALRARLAAGVFDEPDDGEFDFSFGLERVLDGIETLIEQRRTGRG